MIEAAIRACDGLSRLAFRLSLIALLALVTVMIFEVSARYFFGRPTRWAFDVMYMLNGTVYVLAASYALRRNQHVRITFISMKFSYKFHNSINFIFYIFALLPVIGLLVWVAGNEALIAYERGRVAPSPWAPYLWPFYSALAVGLLALWFQILAEAVRHLCALAGRPMEDGHGPEGRGT